MTIPLYKGIVIYKGIYIVKSQILRDFISKIIFRQGFLREETIFFIHFFFFHLRLYFYYPKKHKSDHNNKKRKSKFRVIESWQKKKEQYQLFGTIKENNCYVLDTEVGVSGGGVAVTTRSSFCVR